MDAAGRCVDLRVPAGRVHRTEVLSKPEDLERAVGGAIWIAPSASRLEELLGALRWSPRADDERGHVFTLVPRSIHRPESRCATCDTAARLAKLADVARARGGKLLSTTYVSTANQLWRCERGHRFSLSAEHVVLRGRWCPTCRTAAALGKFTKAMHALAAKRGGAFSSGRYLGEGTRMRWRCAEGHAFEMTARKAKAGAWCRQCWSEKRLAALARIAGRRGGACLADEYRTGRMRWRCRRGHEWMALATAIRKGVWCRVCAGLAPLGLAEMRRVAKSRGGRCCSTRYRSGERLDWECAKGHRWRAVGTTVRGSSSSRATWCPECAGRRPAIADLRAVARARGGACLSSEYRPFPGKLEFRCARGHRWWSTANNVKAGKWCRRCWLDGRRMRAARGSLGPRTARTVRRR